MSGTAAEFGFRVHPNFEDFIAPAGMSVEPTAVIKGTLLAQSLPYLPSQQPGEPPEISFDFLITDLDLVHSEMLLYSEHPYDETHQPVHTFGPAAALLHWSVRYDLPRTDDPLRLCLMIGSGDGSNVVENPHYSELRRTVAVACASAILDPVDEGEDGPIHLVVSNNCGQPVPRFHVRPFHAKSIHDLHEQLVAA